MHGAIAAGHPQTAQAGAEILQRGGNAVDAAVAATFASFVAESALVNIGGGGIAQIYNNTTQQAQVYDFFSTMPGLSENGSDAPASMDFRRIEVDFGATTQPFYIGRGSVAVPGVVAGLCQLLADAGRLSLAEVLQPVIRLARKGVLVTEAQAYIIQLLTPILTDTPKISEVYAPGGSIVTAGETLYFADLAHTLKKLGQHGPELFYSGPVAQAILTDQQENGGLLTATDLSRYQVYSRRPITVTYRGYNVLLPPPSSTGGVLIAFALKLLATVSLEHQTHNSFAHLQLLAEVMRLTNIARADWDDHVEQNNNINGYLAQFLSDEHIARYSRMLQEVLAGQPAAAEPLNRPGPANTTHLSVADADGMVAGITTSAGECSGFLVGNTGLKLNNMLGEIDLHRNGFHRLPPGQRLMTMMSPTLLLKDGRPVLAIGSGGSNRLRSAILQVISNVVDFRLPLTEAVDAPRVHFEDGRLQLEGGILSHTANKLAAAGYDINRWPEKNMFFGGSHAVGRDTPGSKQWVAAGDGRRGGSVVLVK